MKLFKLFLVGLLIIACSSSSGTEDNTEQIALVSELSYSTNSITLVSGNAGKSVAPTFNNGGDQNVRFLLGSQLPVQISIDSITGEISIAAGLATGSYTISVDAENSAGVAAFSNAFSVTITAAPTAPVSFSYSSSTLSVPNSQTRTSPSPSINNGGSAITDIKIFGATPEGVSINPTTGIITASDLAGEGTYHISVEVTNSIGSTTFSNVITLNRRKVDYSEDLHPLFSSKCTPCHVTGSQPKWVDFATAKSNIDNIINRAITIGDMPQGGPQLPQADKDLILQWKTDGLLE